MPQFEDRQEPERAGPPIHSKGEDGDSRELDLSKESFGPEMQEIADRASSGQSGEDAPELDLSKESFSPEWRELGIRELAGGRETDPSDGIDRFEEARAQDKSMPEGGTEAPVHERASQER